MESAEDRADLPGLQNTTVKSILNRISPLDMGILCQRPAGHLPLLMAARSTRRRAWPLAMPFMGASIVFLSG